MKHSSTTFLKLIIYLLGLGTAAGLLWFPQTEGRAANLNLIEIYTDSFILYIYLASTPFFIGLYQAIKLLKLIEANEAFSQKAVRALKNMKIASFCLVGGIVLAQIYLRFFVKGDDLAGPTAVGFVVVLIATVIATAAAVFQKLVQNAIDIKSENDLTV